MKYGNESNRRDEVESYKMQALNVMDNDEENAIQAGDRIIIVKRIEMTFNEKECFVINFTDITAYKRLEKEEETNHLLRTLNSSVHHEMITPLKANVDISERLIKCLKKFPHEKKMVQTILISSQMVLLHANDFLDQKLIENGSFEPRYSDNSI